MKRSLLAVLTMYFTLLGTISFAQERTISGRVTSVEDGSPLPGVNVILKGTAIGTATNAEGMYSLSIPASGGILTFSFVGLLTIEQDIGGRSIVDVQMATDTRQLTEVVVQGYTTTTKRDITGSISSVKGEVLENLPFQTFDRGLQGRLAGVQISSTSGQPGGSINVRIRGTGSVNAGTRPLYIIDGVQVNTGNISTAASSNALGGVNPNDVESYEVLKDASATAIYGAQGANGVVIITTKKGRIGKPILTVNAQEGIVQPMNLYEVMNAQQLAELKIEAYQNNPLRDPADAIALYGDPNDPNLTNYDWVDALFRDARLKLYDISLSGGDERTRYFLSASYNLQEGQLIMSDWERLTTRLNLTTKVNDKFTIGANISLAHQKSFGANSNGNFVNSPFVAAFVARPNVPGRDPETGEYSNYDLLSGGHLIGYNILQGVEEEVLEARTFSTITNLNLSYNILPTLRVGVFAGINADFNRDVNQRPATIPAFAPTGGSSFLGDRRFVNFNTNALLEYSKKLGDVHTISALAGYEWKKETRDQFTATANSFPDPSLRLLSSGVASSVSGVWTGYERTGIFGQVKYDYDDRYIADFTIRRDGSSRFTPDNRFGTFYAGSLAWRVTSESFMEGTSNWLETLKLRASYGITGNSEIANFNWVQSFAPTTAAGRYLNAATVRLNRPLGVPIGWETSVQTNIGIDFGFLAGRISGSVDLWNKLNKDLLFDTQLPFDSGFPSVLQNVGEMRNWGIDYEIAFTPVQAGNFTWRIAYNQTFQNNEVIKLPNDEERIGTTIFKGKSIDVFYGARYAGVNPANGRPMYYDQNGELTYLVTNSDQTFIGDGFVTYYGGIANTFSYKGLSLEVFFQFQGGNDVVNQDSYNLEAAGSSDDNQRTTQLNRWRQPGDIAPNPRAYEGGEPNGSGINEFSTRLLSDGSYARLKQVTLSYSLPKSIVQKGRLSNARIFVQALNLHTFTKFNGIDPEVINEPATATDNSYGTYPNGRQFSAGVSLTF